MFETIQARAGGRCEHILEPIIELAVEIAREGREGRRVGTIFTVGDAEAVLRRSRSLILDPLAGHPEAVRHVTDANLRGTLKELAQLDGALLHHGVSGRAENLRRLRRSLFIVDCSFAIAGAAPSRNDK